jgi:hypothetical protein
MISIVEELLRTRRELRDVREQLRGVSTKMFVCENVPIYL